jgi:hypothetical protein
MTRVDVRTNVYELPRVDVHYVRSPRLLRRVAAGGGDVYLGLRALGSRLRRVGQADHNAVESGVE